MKFIYVAVLAVALLLAVRVMMFGVERPRSEHPRGERSFRLSPPLLVALGIVFGLVGYVLTRATSLAGPAIFVIAAVAGCGAAVITASLVRKWWSVTPEFDVEDERYLFQGYPARVTKAIDAGVIGEVAFEVEGVKRVVPARGLDDAPLAAGAEAVIERIEDDVAYVESWAEVEKRL